jgi:hypothetical protein
MLEELFFTYDNVRECLKKAVSLNITSRKKLHGSIYEEL